MTSVTERTGQRLMTRALLALVLLAGPARSEAQAAIAFVKNVGVGGTTVAGTSISVTLQGSVSVAVGDTLIVTFVMDPAAGAVSCADSRGNSYSVDADVTNGSGTSGVRTVVCSASVATALGNNDTITVTHPLATSKALSVNEFSGLRASALDKTRTEAVRPVGGRASRGGWSRGDVLASGESIAKDDSARSAVRSPRCNRA